MVVQKMQRKMSDEEIIEILERKDRKWGWESRARRETGCSFHRMHRLKNGILAKEKMKNMYFKWKDV